MKVFLETQRLILRQFTEADADHLFELDHDPDVVRFANKTGKPTQYEVVRAQILPNFLEYYDKYDSYGYWAAIEKSSNKFIGWFHFRPAVGNPDEIELGYRLQKSAWGKGYATEGSQALIRKGFSELNTQRVVATALVANPASIRVMEKAGLKFKKKFVENAYTYPGVSQEAIKYALTKDQFQLDEFQLDE